MELTRYSFVSEKACRSHRNDDGREIWTLAIPVGELPAQLKLGPNARYAKLNNGPAKEMLATLRDDPESFIFKNNGIMIVADSIKVEGRTVSIVCHEAGVDDDFPGHGVLNGGHTYAAILEALRRQEAGYAGYSNVNDASVLVTIAIGVEEDAIWQISRARNTSTKVPLHALRELAGDWSTLKRYLPEQSRKLVAFKPNEPGLEDAPYDVTDLVRRLALINNRMFPAELNQHPVKAYTGIGSLVKEFRSEDFLTVAPKLADVLDLETWVHQSWVDLRGKGEGKVAIGQASGVSTEITTLISGAEIPLSLPSPFILPVIAAFRVFLADGEWAAPLQELWDKYGERTVRALWEAYKEQGRSSPAMFGRSKSAWSTTCQLTQMAAVSMGVLKVV